MGNKWGLEARQESQKFSPLHTEQGALARFQTQYTALIHQLAAQSEQKNQQQTSGPTDVPRFQNEYPVV